VVDVCRLQDRTPRAEAFVPGLRHVTVGILARSQSCYSDVFCALSRVAVQSLRTLTTSSLSFEEGSQAHHVSVISRVISSNAEQALSAGFDSLKPESPMSAAAVAMYFGYILSHIQSCLFDERREKRVINFPLLIF